MIIVTHTSFYFLGHLSRIEIGGVLWRMTVKRKWPNDTHSGDVDRWSVSLYIWNFEYFGDKFVVYAAFLLTARPVVMCYGYDPSGTIDSNNPFIDLEVSWCAFE